MCGIAGIFDLEARRDVNAEALRGMTDALAHRGPDGEGFFIEPGIGLGHRRLAIIDIDGGAQPFRDQSGRFALTYNGEIYNYQSLARRLRNDGTDLRTSSDTEALIETWARRIYAARDSVSVPDIIARFDGMFAFAIWDRASHSLTLARDRLGEKPLFYTVTPNGFLLFASEIGALVKSGLIVPAISPEAVMDYFAYGYVPEESCIYKGIHKLPAGHYITLASGAGKPLSTGSLKTSAYWQLRMAPDRSLDWEEAAGTLRHLLDGATKARMMSDVPLGAFLSGGVDSSAIVAAMAQHSTTPIHSCTIGFEEASHDERAYAAEIAELFGTRHETRPGTLDPYSLIDTIAKTYGEPFADSSALPSYLVCALARQSVTVMLSGDGGDEVFAGYRRYPFLCREQKMRDLIPDQIRQSFFGMLGQLYPKLDWAPRPIRFKTTLQALAQPAYKAHMRAVAATPDTQLRELFAPEFIDQLRDYSPDHHLELLYAQADTDDPLLAAQYADIKSWLPGRMLTKIDRASMRHGLEVRPPLLSPELVDWACRLPPVFKLSTGILSWEGKYILKKSQAPRLPHSVLYRPKQGFGLPVAHWMRRATANPLDRFLASAHWRGSGIFNEGQIETMARLHRAGRANHEGTLWALIMYDAFLRVQA